MSRRVLAAVAVGGALGGAVRLGATALALRAEAASTGEGGWGGDGGDGGGSGGD